MFDILFTNFGFWANLAIPFAITFYLVLNHKEYIAKEFGIQMGITLVYLLSIYMILFSTVGIYDTEYHNSKVKSFVFYEEWDEKVTYTESYQCGTSKNPKTCTRTKTRIDHHPEYYIIKGTLGNIIHIKKRDYKNASKRFGETKKDILRFNQVSWGDGNSYVSYPHGNTTIPLAVPNTYENYVKAAKYNVIHTKVPEKEIELRVKNKELVQYPKTYRGIYGAKQLDRVIDTTKSINKNVYLNKLNEISVNVGTKKQANPILYITNKDRDFKNALEQYWNKGKKNDVILILGIDDNGLIKWSDVITYTDSINFIVDMQNNFKNIDIKDHEKILSIFEKNIMESYVRKPMKDYEYLKENIELAWYWQLFIFIGNLIISIFLVRMFLYKK